MKIKKILLTLIVFSSIFLMACGKKDNIYKIYYTNYQGTKLTRTTYKIKDANMSQEEIAKLLLNRMEKNEKTEDLVVIKPKDLKIEKITYKNGEITLDFSENYLELEKIVEALYRTAVVKLLTQIKGVEKLTFTIKDKPIVFFGKKLINMSKSEYTDDNVLNIYDTEWTDVDLYFTNTDGKKLIKTKEKVAYNSDVSLAKIIVKKLIEGPKEKGLYKTIPEKTALQSISIRNNICYVNFNAEFLNKLVNASGNISIYSIVNSLCSLKNINGVKILINGSSENITYRDNTKLDTIFHFNPAYVED